MNKITFILIVLLSIFIGVISPFFLSERFYIDAIHVVTDEFNEKGIIGSYPLTILFYWITGLSKLHFSIIALIQLPILFFILYLIGIPNKFNRINIKNCIIYLSFFMVAIFIGQPSKEFINFIFIALVLFIFRDKHLSLSVCVLITSLMFLFFGVVFRPYFVFMPIIAFSIYLITFIKINNRWLLALILGMCVLVLFSFAHYLLKGDFLSEISRELVNEIRLSNQDENADTMIVSPIPITNIFAEIFSSIYGFITVNFPLNALRFFYKPQVLAFVIWQILLTWIVIVRFGYLLKSSSIYKKELWLMSLLLAYFIIQGIFEPDLGSAVRHKIGILPLIYYLFYYDDFTKQNKSIK